MESLLIKNARVVDPSQQLDRVCDLLVEEGKIARLGHGLHSPGQVVEAAGLVAAPGLVDMHVHLRDPGFCHKEDILTGCAAAAAGGVTSLACMPNTDPVCDSPQVVSYIKERARGAKAKVYPFAAITQGLQSRQLTDQAALQAAGAIGVSDDGKPVADNRLLLEALRRAQQLGLLVSCHAEDLAITHGGILHEGEVSRRLGVPGVDRASEDCNTAVCIALAAASGTRVHIDHVSTAGAAAMIRDAKARGVQVTAETAPHYLMLTHEKLLSRDADYRMAPPLREQADRQALLEAVADGTIDCIVTDHAPHAPAEKADFEKAPNGVVGLETSLAACLTCLVHPGVIPLSRLIELMSWNPARLLGIPAGTLKPGAAADIVLFDPQEAWTVDPDRFASKARNSCFKGMTLTGRVKATWKDGELTYHDRDGKEGI